jgi:hypothetical protein
MSEAERNIATAPASLPTQSQKGARDRMGLASIDRVCQMV